MSHDGLGCGFGSDREEIYVVGFEGGGGVLWGLTCESAARWSVEWEMGREC